MIALLLGNQSQELPSQCDFSDIIALNSTFTDIWLNSAFLWYHPPSRIRPYEEVKTCETAKESSNQSIETEKGLAFDFSVKNSRGREGFDREPIEIE